MATGDEKPVDFYAVLGLNNNCSVAELRNAYKKLALRWHPDRCSAASGKSKEEAKDKFQKIQEAYSILSDANKRLMYDVGVFNSDDGENGMGDFMGEMAQMMSQTKPPNENGHESFEELQQLFVEMFQSDLDAGFGGVTTPAASAADGRATSASSPVEFGHVNNKRGGTAMSSTEKGKLDEMDHGIGGFCFGPSNNHGETSAKGRGANNSSKRRNGRKQKLSSKHDVSSHDTYDNPLVH